MKPITIEQDNYRRKLILLVKQHPVLWEKNNRTYRPSKQRMLAWRLICKQLGTSVERVRRNWGTLRSQYRRDFIRQGKKPRWRFSSEMDFMRDEMIDDEEFLPNSDSTISCAPLTCENVAKQRPEIDFDNRDPPVATYDDERSRRSMEEISNTCFGSSCSQINRETSLDISDDDYCFVMSILPSLQQIRRSRIFPVRNDIMKLIAKHMDEVCTE